MKTQALGVSRVVHLRSAAKRDGRRGEIRVEFVMANIRVFARIKPQLNNRKGKGRQSAASNLQWLVQEDDRELSIDPPGDTQLHGSGTPSSRSRGDRSKKRTFRFDHILSESASQEEVFDSVASGVVDRCLDGFNGTIFAYGVTGSGKTHTVEGSSRRYADRGLIARCLSHLFAKLADKEGEKSAYANSFLVLNQAIVGSRDFPGGQGWAGGGGGNKSSRS